MPYIIGNRKLVSIFILAAIFAAGILVAARPASAIEQHSYSEPVNNCAHVEEVLKSKTEEFTQKRQSHLDKYNQISNILTSATETLENAGYNTVILTELKPGLSNRINQFSEKSQIFLNEMTDVSESACRDEASFRQELEEARTSLKEVQTSVSEIQVYVRNVLIVSVKNVVDEGAN